MRHLLERFRDGRIAVADFTELKHWLESDVDVPEGMWFKRFPNFNTAITGYQEIFTDPSYTGQIVILTNPQIGNYGTNSADNEAAKPCIEGLVVREFSAITSNWRSDDEARDFLSTLEKMATKLVAMPASFLR